VVAVVSRRFSPSCGPSVAREGVRTTPRTT
jgi:hypothetical protein